MTNDDLNQPEQWDCPPEMSLIRNKAWRDGQKELLEWLKIVTVKADYADIGDIRIIAEPDWRRLCTSLGVEP